MNKFLKSTGAALALSTVLAVSPVLANSSQGVSDTEIVLGGHHDLSGPFAAFSVPAVKAINHYFAEINAKGGVHGRMLKYVAEDHGYNVSKVGPAVNKLVNKDKIFAMFMALGTPHNLAAFKIADPKGIPNIMPLSASDSMLNEPYKIHFAGLSSYTDAVKEGVIYLAKEKGATVICSMYLPTDFGKDVQSGAKQGAEAAGLKYGGETTHKPDEGDFVGSLSKLKAEGCNVVATALGIRQTLTVLGTAKKMGLTDMKFLGSSAAFHTVVAKAGEGKIADGYYV
ncbi:Branched-chain amino acid ABC transporter, amino acid-binding protein (TC 3.A.1.4.1), partial [hydrothermal vent metagenome]